MRNNKNEKLSFHEKVIISYIVFVFPPFPLKNRDEPFMYNVKMIYIINLFQVVWTDRFSTTLTYDISRIIDDDRIGVERPFTNDWNLLIHNVKYSDSGKYVCQINTKPVKIKTVMLYVLGMDRVYNKR